MRKCIVLLCILFFSKILTAQSNAVINPTLKNFMWSSSWISCPNAPLNEYGVYHFRKTFDLTEKRDSYIVHISADNRYKFYVNGKEICKSPARSDLQNWHYEKRGVLFGGVKRLR